VDARRQLIHERPTNKQKNSHARHVGEIKAYNWLQKRNDLVTFLSKNSTRRKWGTFSCKPSPENTTLTLPTSDPRFIFETESNNLWILLLAVWDTKRKRKPLQSVTNSNSFQNIFIFLCLCFFCEAVVVKPEDRSLSVSQISRAPAKQQSAPKWNVRLTEVSIHNTTMSAIFGYNKVVHLIGTMWRIQFFSHLSMFRSMFRWITGGKFESVKRTNMLFVVVLRVFNYSIIGF
jgi:hypothetical protein